MEDDPSVSIIIGTYEGLLLGYHLDIKERSNGSFKLTFTDNSHSGSIRAVAVSSTGRYFASSSSDETLQIFSHLFSRPRQVGSIQQDGSTVSLLRFIGDTYLLTVDENGAMRVWETSDWERPIHEFPKTHKRCAPVDVAVHPSGRMALSVAAGDHTVRTWDLARRRQAACTPCSSGESLPVSIFWSSAGDFYCVLYQKRLEIYSTLTCEKYSQLSLPSLATCATFIFGVETIAVGYADGGIMVYHFRQGCDDVAKSETIFESSNESGRIKAMEFISSPGCSLLVSASSLGLITCFRCERPKKRVTFSPLASMNVGGRITCMTVAVDRSGGAGQELAVTTERETKNGVHYDITNLDSFMEKARSAEVCKRISVGITYVAVYE